MTHYKGLTVEMIRHFANMAYVLKHGAKKAAKKIGRKVIMISLATIRKFVNIQIAYRKMDCKRFNAIVAAEVL